MSYIIVTHGPTLGDRHGGRGRCVNEAKGLFRAFHRFPATDLFRVPCDRLIPKALVHLGYLRGLIYTSDKGTHGHHRTYVHFMKTPPRLTCNPQGTQLYVVGGRYRVTPRGIEG